VLKAEGLRPSVVATRIREITQPQALRLHTEHARAAGLRWWSVFESTWANVTLFERASMSLRLADVRRLAVDDSAVSAAADFLALHTA
jgi:hypothetical protein